MRECNSTKREFEYLKKTADVRFRAVGKDFEELLKNSFRAMINVMVDSDKVKKKEKIGVEVKAKTLDKLLIKFLEEILFLLDSENFIASELECVKITRKKGFYVLNAFVLGDKNLKEYDFSLSVKAVTYNDFVFKRGYGFYVAEITLDV
ncbi:MAG: archease [Candidatus Woesearchaeota archaeon]